MHTRGMTRRTGRAGRLGLAAVSALALVGMGLQPVSAAPRGGDHTGRADEVSKRNVERVCGAPQQGEFTCFALRRTDTKGAKGLQPHADPSGYGPADLQGAYQLPADGGAGQTVAIVDAYDDPNAEADLAVYRQQYGLPACTADNGCFSKVDQRGGTDYPTPDADWAGEISLDLDMVSAAAPNAHILLVEADSASTDDLGSSVNTAVELGAKYVSNSYGSRYTSTPGSGESADELTYDQEYFDHPGVAVTVSSGDSDYGVAYPAASQYVTSVGGTSLTEDDSSRGWTESVWHNSYGGPGSGCSMYEPKPSFQTDSGCDMRAVSDVAAVSDPATGVAVYDSYQTTGWGQYGGTSAASPLIAGVYAAAGTPVADTYPNSYPYTNPGSLNDVTEGANGSCDPSYLCTAGAGYDGPTGLGTPAGLAAFRSGPHGSVGGTVTDAATGDPIAGATVKVGDNSAIAGDDGSYTMTVPAGSYDVTASAYGYSAKTVKTVKVTDGGSVTENFALDTVPHASVTGTVTDGSGHAWPLYAEVSVDGVPGGPAYTDPYTGRYSLDLPSKHDYTLHVTPLESGYTPAKATVSLGTADVNKNVAVKVDAQTCAAPGYAKSYDGATESFDGTSTPDGWTVDNATDGGGWTFDDAGDRGNKTGGDGNFAIADSDHLGSGKTQDTTLTSPVVDLSDQDAPEVGFDTYYDGFSGQVGDVDVSVDGGKTWSNVWQHKSDDVTGHQEVALPKAANKSAVQVRFHYTGSWDMYWEVDNMFVGTAHCDPVHGGLVAGTVSDANTTDGLTGATVVSNDKPAETANTTGDTIGGFFWMFSSETGKHAFTASRGGYADQTKQVDVAANYVTKAQFNLAAGQVTVGKSTIHKKIGWGGEKNATFTVTNSGTQPATVKIGEQPGDFQMKAKGTGAPKHNVKAKVTNHSMYADGKVRRAKNKAPVSAAPSDDAWTSIGNFPTPIQDNAVAVYNGKVYSAFGFDGSADSADMYVYDPADGTWTQLASATDTREGVPGHGFINGKFYAVGGWGPGGSPDATLGIYDPASDSWSTGTDSPAPHAAQGSAVLGGKLYTVGGCGASSCGSTDVLAYNPSDDSWQTLADYPEPTAWLSCGGINGLLYCAGGNTDDATSKHGYVYDPSADSWSPIADEPIDQWGAAYTAANGKLLTVGGVIDGGSTVTNQALAYDPASNTWTNLPNANNALYRSGGALGFYQIGGNPGGFLVPPVPASEVLAGYDQGGNADVSWLSVNHTSITLEPGASSKVRVSLNAGVDSIVQPGDYTASLTFQTDTPYSVTPVAVTMTVKPPSTWGKITGTVQGTDSDGNPVPIAGATVEIDSWATQYTLTTDKDGHYALWLDVRNNPLTVIVAKDGYRPQVKQVTIKEGKTLTVTVTLVKP